jgi:hypothetical protein
MPCDGCSADLKLEQLAFSDHVLCAGSGPLPTSLVCSYKLKVTADEWPRVDWSQTVLSLHYLLIYIPFNTLPHVSSHCPSLHLNMNLLRIGNFHHRVETQMDGGWMG